jgi:hypothetical protein
MRTWRAIRTWKVRIDRGISQIHCSVSAVSRPTGPMALEVAPSESTRCARRSDGARTTRGVPPPPDQRARSFRCRSRSWAAGFSSAGPRIPHGSRRWSGSWHRTARAGSRPRLPWSTGLPSRLTGGWIRSTASRRRPVVPLRRLPHTRHGAEAQRRSGGDIAQAPPTANRVFLTKQEHYGHAAGTLPIMAVTSSVCTARWRCH